MGVQLNEVGTRVRCPDCFEWVDVPLCLGNTKRTANEYEVLVSIQEDLFIAGMTAHVLANPEAHPVLAVRD